MFAGGRPAAGHLLLRRQKKVTQEKATPVFRPAFLPAGKRGSLDSPQTGGAVQLALAVRTSRTPLRSSDSARLKLRQFVNCLRRRTGEVGGAHDMWL